MTATSASAAEKDPAPQKKKKKSFIGMIAALLTGLVVLLVLILAVVVIFRDSIVRTATCKAGSFLTGTEVKLQEFSTSLSGKVRIKGFTVKNPAGYSDQNAIELQDVQLDVDLPSLLTDTIKVNLISVNGMRVNFETSPEGNNLKAIQDHLNSITGSKGKEEKPETAPAESGSEKTADESAQAQKNLFIARIDAADNSVSVTSHTLNQGIKLPLPPIHLKDVGGKPVSETLSEICSQLISSITQTAGNLGESVKDIADKSGKAIADKAKSLGNSLKKSSSDFFNSFKKSFK